MEEGERHVLTSGKAFVIRDALSLILAGVKSEGDITPGTRERLWAFVKERCDRLILDLRTAKDPTEGVSPGVRNLRVSHLGQVLVVTGEVTAPEILHEIQALRRPRFFPVL
ncbi:MAG: hypothetical protein P8Z30_05535 [Acidobacteriota bacterium]